MTVSNNQYFINTHQTLDSTVSLPQYIKWHGIPSSWYWYVWKNNSI